MKRLLILFVVVDLLLLVGVIAFLTSDEEAPQPVVPAPVGVVPVQAPIAARPAAEPEPARLIVLQWMSLPVAEPVHHAQAVAEDNGAAPMPFGRGMFGPWDTGRKAETP